MTPLYSVAEIRAIERHAAAALPPGALMQLAGQAAAAAALEMAGGRSILVLAGPGNNGGDALEAAARLTDAGMAVHIVRLASDGTTGPEVAQVPAQVRRQHWDLVIDGLFGIGLARPLGGAARALALAVNALHCPVLALDVPSGLDADTGAIIGPDGVAIQAARTITFIGDKPGLHTLEGRDCAGEVQVAALGIDAACMPPSTAHLNSCALFAAQLAPRRHNSHKGSFGDVVIVGGAAGMAGAPVLAARAALFMGAGRVLVAALAPAAAFDSVHPEIMFRDAADMRGDDGTLVIGPGMGDSAAAVRVLGRALDSASALVVDADALNLVAASPDLQSRLAARKGPSLMTPHPLEAARLLGVTTPVVQSDRLAAAREIAARFQAVVVLKGYGSVIADPHGAVVVNTSGNACLATAGSGDVLAGMAGSLLAQGWPLWEAALGAVWMHGAAAERLVEDGAGPIGMTAGELPAAARLVRNALARRAT